MRPSRPGSISTNAPKSVRRVTAPCDALAGHEALGGGLPRLGLELLEAERDFVGLGIDFEDAQRELLADRENVFGFGDAGAGDVADVEQAVESGLNFNERAVGHEGAYRAGDRVAGL